MRFPLTHSIRSKFKYVGQSRFAGLFEKVTFKQRLEGDEGVSYVCIREKSILVTNLDPTQCPWSWTPGESLTTCSGFTPALFCISNVSCPRP